MKEHRIYTFVDLSSEKHLFLGVTEDYDVQSESTHDWFSDENKRRWLIELLNDSIRSHAFKLRLSFDKVGKKYYYPKGVLKSESIAWTPHVRRALRSLVIEHIRNDRTTSQRRTH